jgi:formate/nitrite transporter FocA (FNT family)
MYHYRSVAAGMMIGLAGLLNLSLGGIPGAIAFGLGLLAVCKLQLDLFTGKMGAFLDKKISIKELLIVFAGNFAGILLIAILGMFLSAYPSL